MPKPDHSVINQALARRNSQNLDASDVLHPDFLKPCQLTETNQVPKRMREFELSLTAGSPSITDKRKCTHKYCVLENAIPGLCESSCDDICISSKPDDQ